MQESEPPRASVRRREESSPVPRDSWMTGACQRGRVQGQILTLRLMSCVNWDKSLCFSEPHLTVSASWTFWIMRDNTGETAKYKASSLQMHMESEYSTPSVTPGTVRTADLSGHQPTGWATRMRPPLAPGPVESLTARAVLMLPYFFSCSRDTTASRNPADASRGHQGTGPDGCQSRLPCELFSTPSLRWQP